MTTARSEVQWKTPNSSDVMYNKEDEKYSAKKGYFIEPFKRITSHCKREECSKRSSRYLKSASVFCVRAVVAAAAATTVPSPRSVDRSLAVRTSAAAMHYGWTDGRWLEGDRNCLLQFFQRSRGNNNSAKEGEGAKKLERRRRRQQ